MSASPSDRTPNQTPNGTLPPLKRRPKPAVDPLVRPKDRNKKVYRPLPASGTAINGVNGSRRLQGPTSSEQRSAHAIPPRVKTPPGDSTKSSTIVDVDAAAHSGFSSKPIAPYTDFPLIISKRKLVEGLRFHVAKFTSKKTIDPRDDNQFVKPLRLHRRDPQAGPGGAGVIKGHEVDSKDGLLNDKERAQQEVLRAQREAERAAEMAQVAPATHTGNQKRSSKFQKRTQQVFRKDQTEEQKESAKLRYEESIPWVLEDFDNKQTWVGGYEAALSKTYAQFVQKDDKFYVTPIEKWYKFTPKTPYTALSIEKAEDLLKQKHKDPKWLQEQMRANREKTEEMQNRKATSGLYVGKSERPTADNIAIKGEDEDARELDFDEENMFADDEENDIFEGVEKEDKDEIAKRVRKDMLSANVFDLKDEKEYTAAEILERKTKQERKQFGKKMKKALLKREKNLIYNTEDSDTNPYDSEVSFHCFYYYLFWMLTGSQRVILRTRKPKR
jgi:transcription initiation factor TFIIF subunit alpha